MRRRGRGAFAALLVAWAGAGCTRSVPDCALRLQAPPLAEFVLVQYTPAALPADPAPDVRSTPKLEEARPKVRAVALRVPDACLQAVDPKGAPIAAPLTLQQVCQDWVLEIERALTGAGLAVFPWDAVLQTERDKHLTTAAAAKELGADVVFVFNHMRAYYLRGPRPSSDDLRTFASDEEGHALGPRTLGVDATTGMRAFVGQLVGEANVAQTVLDVTAVSPSTGEAIWYYQRVRTEPLGERHALRFLFGRRGEDPWSAIQPLPASGMPRRTESAFAIWRDRSGLIVPSVQLRAGAEAFVHAFQGAP